MLIRCDECGDQVSDKAKACQNCGFPVSMMKKEEKNEPFIPSDTYIPGKVYAESDEDEVQVTWSIILGVLLFIPVFFVGMKIYGYGISRGFTQLNDARNDTKTYTYDLGAIARLEGNEIVIFNTDEEPWFNASIKITTESSPSPYEYMVNTVFGSETKISLDQFVSPGGDHFDHSKIKEFELSIEYKRDWGTGRYTKVFD